jgi:hypothetical protein
MATKKVSLNEFREIVKKIIKEESQKNKKNSFKKFPIKESNMEDRYEGKGDRIISDIKKLKSKLNGKSPEVFMADGLIKVSAEDGSYFADYYGEFRDGYPHIDPRLEKIADMYDTYWEWEDAGSIILAPLD